MSACERIPEGWVGVNWVKRARKNIAGWRAAGAEISEEENEASTGKRRPGWLQN